MEASLFLDRLSPDLPDSGFCLRLIFLGLCTAIGTGLLIPGLVLAYNGWKEQRADATIPSAIILPTALVCFICACYLFVRWTRQQIHMYHRVRSNENGHVEMES